VIFAAGVAAAVVALIVAAGGGAAGRAERPPAGFLIGIRGTGGCVGQAGVQPGHGADYPAKDDCAAGRGLRQVHHIALSPDERFVYTAAGLVANPPDDDGAIDVFRRRADGSIMQLPGAHGCVKRPHPVEGREGCGVARGIEGARFIVLSADGRFLYAGSPTGIAISTATRAAAPFDSSAARPAAYPRIALSRVRAPRRSTRSRTSRSARTSARVRGRQLQRRGAHLPSQPAHGNIARSGLPRRASAAV